MAQKKTTGNSSKKKTSASRPKSSSNASRSRKAPVKAEPQVTYKDMFHRFSKTRFFRPVMTVLIILVLVLLDLLFSWNSYNVFFTLLGIELLAGIVIWIVLLLKSASASSGASGQE